MGLAFYNISWQPPLYLGGLNLNDMKYDVTIYSYDSKVKTYTSYNTTHVIIRWTVREYEELRVKVHFVCKETNCKFLPSNMHAEATYDAKYLVEAAISEFNTSTKCRMHLFKFYIFCRFFASHIQFELLCKWQCSA